MIMFPMVVSFLCLLSLSLAKMLKAKRRERRTPPQYRLLPSPPRLPVIGHLHLVGFLPHVTHRDLAARYSTDGFMLIHLGMVPTLVVSSPCAAKAVLRTYDSLLASRPPSTVAQVLLRGPLDVAFAVYGDNWREARKLLTVHMLTTKKVQSYRPGREEMVRLAMARVSDAAASGKTLDMSELLYAFTSDLMCHAVSRKFLNLESRSKVFRHLLDATATLIGGGNHEDFFPWLLRLKVFRSVIFSKAAKLRKQWDELLDGVIDDHHREVLLHPQEPCFLEVLLSRQQQYGLTRDHIKGLLIDVFFGGTDTSYLVLECLMIELTRNPLVMAKLQDELRRNIPNEQDIVTEDDLNVMIYLKAVIKETLRLHPPAPLLAPHHSMEDVNIDGYMVSAEMPILINAWAIGRDTNVWEDAEIFKPERFIGTGDVPLLNFERHGYQFLPFGAGRRMCPGMNLAISTLEIMSANLIRSFNWEIPEGMARTGIDMTEVFHLTVHLKEKLVLVPTTHGVTSSN